LPYDLYKIYHKIFESILNVILVLRVTLIEFIRI
jgi:hypothetical protein